MASYTIAIPDAMDAGITAARLAYNASLPPSTPPDARSEEGDLPERSPMDDNKAYVQFVMASAANSYCKQYDIEIVKPPAGRTKK